MDNLKHTAKRWGFEARHVKKNTVRPFGAVAYARAYAALEEKGAQIADREQCRQLQGKPFPGRDWRVEYLHANGHWIVASRNMQCKSVDAALRQIVGLEDRYRVMVRDAFGGWKRRSAPRVPVQY